MKELSMDDAAFVPFPDLTGASGLPAHTRIGYWLERIIITRKVQTGDKLPAEVDLAAALGVSRMTLRQALASVDSKGLLDRRRGRFGGNFIAQPRVDFSLSGLPGFTEQMRRSHVTAGAQVVQATTRTPPPEVRTALQLKRGDQVHEIIRVRSANGDPIAVEETYLPAAILPGFLDYDLTDSLYRVLEREYGRDPHSAEEIVEPRNATAHQAELLDVQQDIALLLVTRTTFTRDDVPIEYSRDFFRPDRTRIILQTRADQSPVSNVATSAPAREEAL